MLSRLSSFDSTHFPLSVFIEGKYFVKKCLSLEFQFPKQIFLKMEGHPSGTVWGEHHWYLDQIPCLSFSAPQSTSSRNNRPICTCRVLSPKSFDSFWKGFWWDPLSQHKISTKINSRSRKTNSAKSKCQSNQERLLQASDFCHSSTFLTKSVLQWDYFSLL